MALGLRGLGLEPGERVLLQFTNSGWAVVAWYGVLKAGLIPVATLALHRSHEIFDIAQQCTPAAHIVEADFTGHDLVALAQATARQQPSLRVLLTVGSDRSIPGAVAIESLAAATVDDDAARRTLRQIQHDAGPDSLACLQLSGGTTNTPKLIPVFTPSIGSTPGSTLRG